MEGLKSLWQSKSVMGSVIAIIAFVLNLQGYSVSTENQAQIVDIITQITGIVGAGVALWGRIIATQKIKI